MENALPWIIQLISGAVGGNLAGSPMKKLSLGTLLNSVAGVIGGAGGAQLLAKFTELPIGTGDWKQILGSVASGGVGGGVVLAIVGLIKSVLGKK